MVEVSTPPLSGRRAEASRNDERVLEAARAVLTASPSAPMAEIAQRAGVGIGTLYRRYPSKEALVQHLCLDGMQRLEAAARTALDAVDEDAWQAFSGFMTAGLAAGAGSLGATLAGPLRALGAWSLTHGKRVEEARGRFDERLAAKRAA